MRIFLGKAQNTYYADKEPLPRTICTPLILIAALVLTTGSVFAKDSLAILPFSGGVGEEGETIAELFSFERELIAVCDPVPRTSINRAIRGEQRFQMESGMTDPDTIAALGRQLGALYVVSESITSLGNQNLLVIWILKIDDLRQIAGDVQTYRTIEEIQDKLPSMARTIAAAATDGKDAAALPRLAVPSPPPVELSGGAEARDADTLARILAVRIIGTGSYAVYPRTASLEDGLAVMEELAFALTGKWQRTVFDAAAFTQAIAAVNTSSRDDVTIILNGSFAAESVTFTGGAAKTITLRGEGANRTITNSGDAELFTVPAGITLVLDNNLVLDGNKKKARLVNVMGGTLVMKDGSTLRGSGAVGVYVGSGNFTMSGGTIDATNSAKNGR